jgi:hypothetical protein
MIIMNILIVMARLGFTLVGTPDTGAGATAAEAWLWTAAGACEAGADDEAATDPCDNGFEGSSPNPAVARKRVIISGIRTLVIIYSLPRIEFP